MVAFAAEVKPYQCTDDSQKQWGHWRPPPGQHDFRGVHELSALEEQGHDLLTVCQEECQGGARMEAT